MTPEGKTKAAIKKLLKELGIFVYMPVQSGLGVVGIPDFVCCRPVKVTSDMVGKTIGQFIGVEAKAPGKRGNTTANQKVVLEAIAEHGGTAVVVDDVSQLKEILHG
jgi:hypothetical protein